MPKARASQQDRRRAERAGRWAERLVSLRLQLSGYRILARRYRSRAGEIDLIASRGRTLVFVEVKQRARLKHAVDPVSARSEERIIRAGESWLAAYPSYVERGFGLRYDVVTVIGRWRIVHLKDAFRGW